MMKTNGDLQMEREKCTFKIEELTNFIHGGPEKTKEKRESDNILINNEELFSGVPEDYLSHKEKYENVMKKSIVLFGLIRKMQNDGRYTLDNYKDALSNLLPSSPMRDGSPMGINLVVFMPAIFTQGTEEQQTYWIRRAWDWEIIGCLAQTELGHGTFVRGLETTATYDPDTQEFVVHSPTLTSYKWWPGGMGQTANYGVVAAQLYSRGTCYGVHFFVVQIRDEETHMPMPGVKVGEIGAKLAHNGVNNGFLGLDHVRIPRKNMLMKHAQILEDGTYVKSRNSKLNYGIMMFVRIIIVSDMVYLLSRGVTIAVRYSAVRRQCQLKKGEQETQVLDYVTQQHKLFIAIAASHAFRSTASMMWNTYNTTSKELDDGNYERLPELHALSCCLKAVSTSDTARYVETCKLSCGGHGYMLSSNLPHTCSWAAAACTYEGENTVLLLQTARYLAKTWQQMDNAKLTPTVQYMKDAQIYNSNAKWENTVEYIIRGFEIVAMRKIKQCVDCMTDRVNSGMSFEDAWNMTSVQLVSAAEAHCRLLILRSFNDTVRNAALSAELRRVMKLLVELYAVYWTLEKIGDLVQYVSIDSRDVAKLQAWYEEILLELRPNAVGLVDAFDIDDRILQSTLGAYDGRVYERLMEEALKSPLNAEPVNHTFHKYLKPFMQGKL